MQRRRCLASARVVERSGDGGNGKRTDDCISSSALGAGLLRTGPAVEKSKSRHDWTGQIVTEVKRLPRLVAKLHQAVARVMRLVVEDNVSKVRC